MSFYLWKIKVTWSKRPAAYYDVGFSYYPHGHLFEVNLGKYVLVLWYRKDLIR